MKRPILWTTIFMICGIYMRLGISKVICLVSFLFLLFFIICQFGAIVSDSHIWDWGVYLALNILIVLYVYLRPGETRTKSSQQKLLIAVLIHTAVIISTLWRAYRVSFIMDIFFDILDFWAILGFILILKFGLSKR